RTGCDRGDGRYAAREALRLIHDHERQLAVFQKADGVIGMSRVEPARRAELHGADLARETTFGIEDRRRAGLAGHEPAWILEQNGAELSRSLQRRERVKKDAPEFIEQFTGQILAVDACLLAQFCWQRIAERLGQSPHF